MVRDIPVAGIRDKTLSEWLQLDGDLTLVKAMTSIQQLEMVQQQQALLHDKETKQFWIDVVKTSRKTIKNRSYTGKRCGQSKHTIRSRCGKGPNHDIEVHVCPAKGVNGTKCGKKEENPIYK